MKLKDIFTKEVITKNHYVYDVTNHSVGRSYIGVRTSKNGLAPSKDLGYIYFSSSSDKDFIIDQKNNPSDYTYTILCEFATRVEAAQMEVCLHAALDVGASGVYYNRCRAMSNGFDRHGIAHSEESKSRMRDSHLNKSPIERIAIANKFIKTMNNKSIQEKEIIKAKTKLTKDNRSVEEKAKSANKFRATTLNRPSSRKALTSMRRSTATMAAHKNRSIEDREIIKAKTKLTKKNKTSKEKDDIAAKRKFTMFNKSVEEKEAIIAKIRATKDSRSVEENAITSAKLSKSSKLAHENRTIADETKRLLKIKTTKNNKSIADKAIISAKLSESNSGSKNHAAILVHIFDSEDVLRFKCHGTFRKTCNENSLPYSILKKSYQNNLGGFSAEITKACYFNKFKHCEGWYARKI